MILDSFQAEKEVFPSNLNTGNIATVSAVYSDGITLILPGNNAPTQKRYPYNSSVTFSSGQRVHILREGGTIIVEYPIGGMINVNNV